MKKEKKLNLKDIIKNPKKYEEEIFWYIAGATTVIGLFVIGQIIETIIILSK